MPKRFVNFASLFAAVALLLGLMVTGCSEGSSSLAEETEITVVRATVGLVSGKMDCPKTSEYLALAVKNADGVVAVNGAMAVEFFGAEAGKATIGGKRVTVNEWSRNGNSITLTMQLSKEELAQEPSGVLVVAYDSEGNPLGLYSAEKSIAKGANIFDFTEDDAGVFMPVSELDCELAVLGTEDGVLSVPHGDEVPVRAQLTVSYKGEEILVCSADDITMTKVDPENQNIDIDNEVSTITGVIVSKADDNEVLVSWNNVTCTIKVEVASLEFEYNVYLTIYDEAAYLSDGDVVKYDYTVEGGSTIGGGGTWRYKADEAQKKVICQEKEGAIVTITSCTKTSGATTTTAAFRDDNPSATVTSDPEGGDNTIVIAEWK